MTPLDKQATRAFRGTIYVEDGSGWHCQITKEIDSGLSHRIICSAPSKDEAMRKALAASSYFEPEFRHAYLRAMRREDFSQCFVPYVRVASFMAWAVLGYNIMHAVAKYLWPQG